MNVSPEPKRTRFTEGPWRAVWGLKGDPYFDILKCDGDADDDGRMVDASYSIVESAYPVIADDEARANANLIAASPGLYRALSELRALLIQSGRWTNHPASPLGRAGWNAEMALAYARGEDYRFDENES